MEQFKLDCFLDEQWKAMEVTTLSISDSANTVEAMLNLCGLAINNTSTADFYNYFEKNAAHKLDCGGGDKIDTAALRGVITKLNVDEDSTCFLIGYLNDEIDSFDLGYLLNNWEYIWYEDDGLLLFVAEYKLIILVTHYGCIFYN